MPRALFLLTNIGLVISNIYRIKKEKTVIWNVK